MLMDSIAKGVPERHLNWGRYIETELIMNVDGKGIRILRFRRLKGFIINEWKDFASIR